MQRLHRLIVATLILLAGPWTVSAQELKGAQEFLLDGHDSEEGMSAILAMSDHTLIISGELFHLEKCNEASLSVCIKSDYMILALPSGAQGRQWTAEGYKFSYAGDCTLRVGGRTEIVEIVKSDQKLGTFTFYLGSHKELLGWALKHQNFEGEFETDRYTLRGG